MATAVRKRPKIRQFFSGPWDGVLNASDIPEAYKTKLYDAQNMFISGAESGGGWQLRAPFVLQKAGGALGTAGGRYGQCIFEHIRLDGTIDRYLFVGGKMYEWDGNTPGTYTDITPGAVTISATARIYCLTFANMLIVSDGVNKPWQYNPATATATVINYDSVPSAWTAYGRPVVNGGALHFIVNTVAGASLRTDFVWSEPGQPLVGYKQTGYLNTWTLTQTEADPLYALAASNAALYYFRKDSIGAITGVVGPNYQAGATLDSVSTDVGTTTPASVIVAHGAVWFLDELGHPWRFPFGGEPQPIWLQARDALAPATILTVTAQGFSVNHPDIPMVLMMSAQNQSLTGSTLYAFNATTGDYRGQWDCDGRRTIHTMGVLRDSGNNRSLCVLGGAPVSVTATDGAFLRQRTLSEMAFAMASWSDDNGTTISSVLTHQLGMRDVGEWQFDLVAVRARTVPGGNTYNMDLQYFTPRTTSTLSVVMSTPALINSTNPALGTGVVGVVAVGRAISILLIGTTLSQHFSVPLPSFMPDRVSVTAIDGGADPLAI